MADDTVEYKSRKGKIVRCKVSTHAIIRFRQRYPLLFQNVDKKRDEMRDSDNAKIICMIRERLAVATMQLRGRYINERSEKYGGGSIYFTDGSLRYVFTDAQLVTVELTNHVLNRKTPKFT